jgi:magnesium transporter
MIEIEMSSRYIETADTLVVNSNFLLSNFEVDPVSFILKNNILVTVRSQELYSFHETVKKISANPKNYKTGADVLVALFETRVEFDADMIEDMTQKILSSVTVSVCKKLMKICCRKSKTCRKKR